jgi:hypothetical protein
MAFIISYRDPRRPGTANARIVSSEPQVREAIEGLQREGYEVVSTVGSWQPSRTIPYACLVIKQDVQVEISTMDSYGQGQFQIDQGRRMDGCSGAHICKLFAEPRMFHAPGPVGCPFHTSMNGG